MSFVATGNGNPELPPIIDPFFPAISPADFRASTRQDDTVTDSRLVHALQSAIDDVNRRLSAWRASTVPPGTPTLADVSTAQIGSDKRLVVLYRRAVYAQAKAELSERYKDYAATQQGISKAEDRFDQESVYRRDASWAIADITGRRRTTVDLI